MEINIDKGLLDICNEIKEMGYSLEDWRKVESCDMFQSEHYCGGFCGIAGEL